MKRIIPICIHFISIASFAGNLDTIRVFSPSMGKMIPCVVILPKDYKITIHPLAVIYLLHGYGSNFAQWPTLAPQLKDRADELNLMLVCPDGGYSSWYFDSPVDSTVRYETFVSKELVNYIDSHYHTHPDKQFRAISGLSMGGHGALYLAIRHKNIFGAAGSTSGVVDFPSLVKNQQGPTPDSAGNSENGQRNSVMSLAGNLKNGELKLIIDCGVSDWLCFVNRNLHQKLLAERIDHDYIERPGKHNVAYWENSIDYQLLFFKKYFEEGK